MQFRTIIPISPIKQLIDYQSKTFFIGSCFSGNISQKFSFYKLKNTVNPFGVIFNPIIIEQLLYRIKNQLQFTEDELFYYNELWSNFQVHSEFSSTDKNIIIQRLNQQLEEASIILHNATHLIITLGTAWVYRHLESDKIVANCHKVPQKEFSKELLSVQQITESLQQIIKLFPDKNIILTLSPVRHIKDGFFENNVSKSHLISSIYNVFDKVNYFPSYEIVIDELRDYRFFEADMIHPNSIAVDYIWNRFQEHYLSKEAQNIALEIASIQKALNHKPFNQNTKQHQRFVEHTQKRIEQLGNLWW